MPRGDGTGPRGGGPRTGRGLGTCPPKPNTEEGTDIGQGGQGRGVGAGRGRGLGVGPRDGRGGGRGGGGRR